MSYYDVKEFIEHSQGNVYKQVELLSANSDTVNLKICNNQLLIVPNSVEWREMTSSEKRRENFPILDFLPDYKNMDSKVKLLEHMGVEFL